MALVYWFAMLVLGIVFAVACACHYEIKNANDDESAP